MDIRTRLGIRSLDEIRETKYKDPVYAIPGIVPEGLTLLAGPPKVKKSWFALAAAIAVGTGGIVLGKIKVEPGRVLYLALEDRERRLQSRANSILPDGGGKLHNLDMVTKWRRLDRGGLEDLREYLTAYPETRFVIVDTLAMVRQRKLKNQSDYDADYDAMARLKRVAEDFLDAVIGTHGVSGAADGVIVLKRARCSDLATLSITGRDIEEEREIVIEWDQATCIWHMTEGDPAYVKLSPERKRIIDILRNVSTPLSSKQIATAVHGREMGNKNDQAWKSVRTLLGLMVESRDITQLSNKAYTLEGSNNE